MAYFHSMTSIALGYILGCIHFHVGPPEILLQILVHLGTAGMNRELRHMSLIKDDLLNFQIDKNHKAFPKLDHTLVIFSETSILGVSLCQFLFDGLYVFINVLSSDNSIIEIGFCS
jgi:hypothetical protein